MRRPAVLVGLAILSILALAVYSFVARHNGRGGGPPRPRETIVPAEDVRSAVSGVSEADVKHFVVTVLLPDRLITDRTSVALLLSGLKNAGYPEPMPQNRVDSVLAILKDGRKIGPFAFSTDRCVDAFSPEFCEGLRREGIAVPGK